MAGQSLAFASSDAWAAMGSQAETALNSGWILDQTITSTGGFNTAAAPSTATAFLSSGDGTTGSGNGFWAIGRLARVVHTGGTAYATVQSAAYGAPVTTVTIGDFQSGGTTSLSTTAITTAAAGYLFNSPTGNDPTKVRILNRTTTTVVGSTASVTSDSTLYTFNVPGGCMGTSGILRLTMHGDLLNNTGAALQPGIKVLFGATTVLSGSTNDSSILSSANRRYWRAEVMVQNVSATNSQRVSAHMNLGNAGTSALALNNTSNVYMADGYGTAVEASSANLALAFVVRLASTATTVDMQLRHATLELIQ